MAAPRQLPLWLWLGRAGARGNPPPEEIEGQGLEITPAANRLHWNATERETEWTAALNRLHWRSDGD